MNKNNYFLFTSDVETTSLYNHRLSDKTGEKVLKEGMPVLLELYRKYGVKSTFFFTGYIASKFPNVVRMILDDGHEVGSHGLVHNSDQAFDVLSLNVQIEHLKRSKEILEDISNQEVISFRAPALRVNRLTPIALEKAGFLIDSSISPQRIDFIFSFGLKHKLRWILAPRVPYFTDENNLAKKGHSSILEIPVNSYLLPYVGTFMRISPSLTKLIRKVAEIESNISSNIPNFIIHPNEFLEEKIEIKNIHRRSKNFINYLLGDKLRYHLKLKNLGKKALPLFEDQISHYYRNNYKFVCLRDLYKEIYNESYS